VRSPPAPLQSMGLSSLIRISSFIVQVAGAVQAVGDDISTSQITRGIDIYMGGVSVNLPLYLQALTLITRWVFSNFSFSYF
jgi:hypothetical protein